MKSSSDPWAPPPWQIGQLAARFELPTHVLRHWEDIGLLDPARDGGGRRSYDEDDLVRIAVILRSKAAGMALDQIAALLDAEKPERRSILATHLAELDQRMTDMRLSREMTSHALECRNHDIAHCPRFREAVADLVAGRGGARKEWKP